MNQNIELYKPELWPKVARYNFKQTVTVFSLFNLLAIVLAALLFAFVAFVERQNDILEKEQARLTVELENLGGELANQKEFYASLSAKIKIYQEIIQEKRELLAFIVRNQDNEGTNFYEFLLALSRASFDNIWVKSIKILDYGKNIIITGGVVHSSDFMSYIISLGKEKSFSGLKFDLLDLKRDIGDNAHIGFILSTKDLNRSKGSGTKKEKNEWGSDAANLVNELGGPSR